MAHRVEFSSWDKMRQHLELGIIRDLVDVMYDGPDSKFVFVEQKIGSRVRGQCASFSDDLHEITISLDVLAEHHDRGMRLGGNFKHDRLDVAILSVITHELRHANQLYIHPNRDGRFWSGKYFTRPCEVDARNFVDRNEAVIRHMLGDSTFRHRSEEEADKADKLNSDLLMVAEIFAETVDAAPDFDYIDDLTNEMKISGIFSPDNFFEVQQMIALMRGH